MKKKTFPYNVILDELLVAQENLLPAEDGGLGPGLEGSGAGVRSCQHLRLGSFGNSSHHLISGLRSRRESTPDKLIDTRGSHYCANCIFIYLLRLMDLFFLSFTGLM